MKKTCSVLGLILLAMPIFAQLPAKATNFSKLEETILAEGATLSIGEAEMKNYVGVYTQPNRWKSEIFIRQGKLFIQEFNREMPLTKIGENRFSFEFPAPGTIQEISFKIGADGKPVALNQYVWAFKRTSDSHTN